MERTFFFILVFLFVYALSIQRLESQGKIPSKHLNSGHLLKISKKYKALWKKIYRLRNNDRNGKNLKTIQFFKKDGSKIILPLVALAREQCHAQVREIYIAWGLAQVMKTAPSCVKYISLLLKDKHWCIRALAARAFYELKEIPVVVIADLAKLLRDRSQRVRINSMDALSSVGEKAIISLPFLLSATKDPNLWIRLNALRVIGKIGEKAFPQATSTVVQMLVDPLLWSRLTSAEIIYKYRHKMDITVVKPALSKALKDPNEAVQIVVLKTLQDIEIELYVRAWMKMLRYSSPHARYSATVELGKFGEKAKIAQQELLLLTKDPFEWVRKAAILALRKIMKENKAGGQQMPSKGAKIKK